MKSTTNSAAGKVRVPALVAIAADLERMLHATTKFADAAAEPRDVDLAFRSLALAVNKAIDALATMGGKLSLADLGDDLSDAKCAARMDRLMLELAGSLPPVRGGCDDHEVIDPEFLEDPHGWPAEYTPELDGYLWAPTFDGPTPIEVLEADRPTWEPSDADWDDAYAASAETYSPGTLDEMVLRGYGHLAAR